MTKSHIKSKQLLEHSEGAGHGPEDLLPDHRETKADCPCKSQHGKERNCKHKVTQVAELEGTKPS